MAALSKLCAAAGCRMMARAADSEEDRTQHLTCSPSAASPHWQMVACFPGRPSWCSACLAASSRRPAARVRFWQVRRWPAGCTEKCGADRGIGLPGGDDYPLALVGRPLLPAFDRHREIDSGDLLVIAKLGLGGLLRAADPARLVDLDLEIGVGVEQIGELVAVLLRDLELVGQSAVEILAAEILNSAAVLREASSGPSISAASAS